MLHGTLSSRSDVRVDLSVSKLTKPFYTTLDDVSGRVVYAPNSSVDVRDVIIDFLGTAKTWVDPSTPGVPRKRAVGQVLRLVCIFLLSSH
jgi:hypothetical protein